MVKGLIAIKTEHKCPESVPVRSSNLQHAVGIDLTEKCHSYNSPNRGEHLGLPKKVGQSKDEGCAKKF